MSFAAKLQVDGRKTSLIPDSPGATHDSAFFYIDADGTRVDVPQAQLCDVLFLPRRGLCCSPASTQGKGPSGDARARLNAGTSFLSKVLTQFNLPLAEKDGQPDQREQQQGGVVIPSTEPQFLELRRSCEAAGRPLVAAFVAVPSCNCQLFFPAFRELWLKHRQHATFACVDLCRCEMPHVARHVASVPSIRVYLPPVAKKGDSKGPSRGSLGVSSGGGGGWLRRRARSGEAGIGCGARADKADKHLERWAAAADAGGQPSLSYFCFCF